MTESHKSRSAMGSSTTKYSIADLYDLVKTYDKEFSAGKEVNAAMLDEDGTPNVFYHATDAEFTAFDRTKSGENTIGNATDVDAAATAFLGFWFNGKDVSETIVAKNAMPVYLSIQNPYIAASLEDLMSSMIDEYGETFEELQDRFSDGEVEVAQAIAFTFRDKLENEGYDGIFVKDEEFGGVSLVAFEETQIKSATDNVGTFDKSNPDIRYSTCKTEKPSAIAEAVESLTGKPVQSARERLADAFFKNPVPVVDI